jgi:hypothetical protein
MIFIELDVFFVVARALFHDGESAYLYLRVRREIRFSSALSRATVGIRGGRIAARCETEEMRMNPRNQRMCTVVTTLSFQPVISGTGISQ